MGWKVYLGGAPLGTGLLVLVACDDATPNPDRPVRSTAEPMAATQIREGVVGRLTTSSGRPIATAQITAQSLDQPTRPIPEIAILSDADGRFIWSLRPGRYRLAALVDGHEVAAVETAVEPGRVTNVELSAR